MRIVITFLVGLTAGVGVVRLTEGLTTAQGYLLRMFGVGVALGLAACVICAAPWAEDKDE